MLVTDHGGELDEQVRLGLERIRNSAERMGRLTLDLLTYTDLTRADYQKQPVDLEAVCGNVLRLFSDEIARTKANVAVEVSSEWVLADTAGVERVLVNLFGNALKFTQPGRSPAIRLSANRRNNGVRVSVEDNGVGIDPIYRERIFGVFERLSSVGNNTGTGIGLAIVKRSVEKMGGTVGVESELGKGSRFWFELPKAEPPVAPESGNRSIFGQLPEQKFDRPLRCN